MSQAEKIVDMYKKEGFTETYKKLRKLTYAKLFYADNYACDDGSYFVVRYNQKTMAVTSKPESKHEMIW